MPQETFRLDFQTLPEGPQPVRLTFSCQEGVATSGPQGERRGSWNYRGPRLMLLALVRLARWQGRETSGAERLPLLAGQAVEKAPVPDVIALGRALHQYKVHSWLRDMISIGGPEGDDEAGRRISRWFHRENATGRSRQGEMSVISAERRHLPPEAVQVWLDGRPVSPLELDRLERRLSAIPGLEASWPPFLPGQKPLLAGYQPTVSPKFVRRDECLAHLDRLYDRGDCQMVIISAAGGQGKTTVALEWLRERMNAGSLRQELVFYWPFYLQGYAGCGGQWMHDFWWQLGAILGVPVADDDVPAHRADAMAAAMRTRPTLLLLDGLEVLLRPGCALPGGIQDAALALLVESIAYQQVPGSWVLATSRELLSGRLRSIQPAVEHYYLPDLDAMQAQPLPPMPVEAPDRPTTALEWSLSGWGKLADSSPQQLIQATQSETAESRLRALIRRRLAALADETQRSIVLGAALFDRPAEWQHLHPLLNAKPPIPGISPEAEEVPDEAWSAALEAVIETGLLRLTAEGALEMHPEIRRCLADDLSRTSPRAWSAAQVWLRDHFGAIPTKDTPDTLDEMAPLFRAMWHGVQAGEARHALDHIAIPRLCRGTSAYLIEELGADAEALTMAECVCPDHLSFPSGSDLTSDQRVLTLVTIGYVLERMGRLREARESADMAWSLVQPGHQIDVVGPTACLVLRLRTTHGDDSGCMEVMLRLLCAFLSAPLSPQSLGVPPAFIGQALGWSAVTCARALWDMGKPRRARVILWTALQKCRALLGRPSLRLLPAASRLWHALLLLDMGQWQTCQEAEEAGELEGLDLHSRRTGMEPWVRGACLRQEAQAMRPGPHRDELAASSLRLLHAALETAQRGRYLWHEASIHLELVRLHLGVLERGDLAEKHRFHALRIAQDHGFLPIIRGLMEARAGTPDAG